MWRAEGALPAGAAHRPWPPPARPWSLAMRWHDLLFAHWPVPPRAVRPLVPAGLELDAFDGSAWIGVVPFRMTGVRLRRLPAFAGAAFPELNVRTYVTAGGRPGVWFFSLDASSRAAVRAARLWFGLPYFDARIRVRSAGDAVRYHSTRTHRGAPPAGFEASYRPTGPPRASAPGSLEHWLTERYCLYALRRGRLLRGEIHHAPWPLQPAEAEIRSNTMARAAGIDLPESRPLLHYAGRLDVVAWAPEPAGG